MSKKKSFPEGAMIRAMWTVPFAWLLSSAALLAQPTQVLIIRHAEKPEEGHCLSVKGWQRAAALVPFFLCELSDECGNRQRGFARPMAIYAQTPTKENKSLRPVQTVRMLAQALKVEVKGFAHVDFGQMVKEIQTTSAYEGQTVLICWEHHGNEDIARAFGVEEPPKWHGSSFDRIWVITSKDGKAKLRDMPQQLMYGDSAE
jgi:hypothetical protein